MSVYSLFKRTSKKPSLLARIKRILIKKEMWTVEFTCPGCNNNWIQKIEPQVKRDKDEMGRRQNKITDSVSCKNCGLQQSMKLEK